MFNIAFFEGEDLPVFPVEQQSLTELRRRVNIVRQIETQEYRCSLYLTVFYVLYLVKFLLAHLWFSDNLMTVQDVMRPEKH